jgi:hypothetical protein
VTDCNINKILRDHPRNCARGAPMGAIDIGPMPDYNPQLRCQRVYLVDGDYGPDGTYWGASEIAGHIYCAFNDGRDSDPHKPAMGVRIYVRAFTYEQAKREVKQRYPQVTFVRGGR